MQQQRIFCLLYSLPSFASASQSYGKPAHPSLYVKCTCRHLLHKEYQLFHTCAAPIEQAQENGVGTSSFKSAYL